MPDDFAPFGIANINGDSLDAMVQGGLHHREGYVTYAKHKPPDNADDLGDK
jgi:hypothetical protein